MAYITTGLTNGGVTSHYKFSYDSALAGAAARSRPAPTPSSRIVKPITT